MVQYLNRVKAAFADEEGKYSKFLETINGFKADQWSPSDAPELIKKVREMFDGEPALLEELKMYLRQ